MEHTIASFDARRNFGRVLREVIANGDRYVVERHGEPVAALIPIEQYEQWKRTRDAFFDRLEATARRSNMPEDEAMELALEEIAAARAERRRTT